MTNFQRMLYRTPFEKIDLSHKSKRDDELFRYNQTRGILILCLIFIFGNGCHDSMPYKKDSGRTMGTTYSVIYQSFNGYSTEISDVLIDINSEVSTYISDSDISMFNRADKDFVIKAESEHFYQNWKKAKEVYDITDGYFDPTVMSIINYWGFGYEEKNARIIVDSLVIEALMNYVGMEKIGSEGRQLTKGSKNIRLDFSAIAKGYAVDEIANLLNDKKVENYLVEIGGEVYAKGVNNEGGEWRLGINTPKEDAAINDFEIVVTLSGQGMASSGNYRNFYIVDGRKYGHTINPHTGYPSLNDLLGVTVIADDCMTADAYATAYMAMGIEKALANVINRTSLEACFFTGDDKGNIEKIYSNGFVQHLTRK